MNMKQGGAKKKGACMLFPWINRGEMASVLGMKNLKWFAIPVYPESYSYILACSTVWLGRRMLMEYGQM